jgi:TolB-like protein
LFLAMALASPCVAGPRAASSRTPGGLEKALEDLAEQIEAGASPSGRVTVAVLEFEGLGGDQPHFARYTTEVLSTTLARRGRFRVIERRRLGRILEELKLNASALFDPENRKKFGRVSGVEAILIGSYQNFQPSVRLNARLVATETGETLAAGSVTGMKDGDVKKLLGEPAPGSLTVRTEDGAKVYLNGALKGKAEGGTLRIPGVEPGGHRVELRKMGKRRVSATVIVGDSEDASITLGMQRVPGPEAMFYSLLFPGAGSVHLGRSMFGGGDARYAPMAISLTCLSFYGGFWLGEWGLVRSAKRHQWAGDYHKADVRYRWARVFHRSKPYLLYAGAGMAAVDVVYCFFAGTANSLTAHRSSGRLPRLAVVLSPDGGWAAGVVKTF